MQSNCLIFSRVPKMLMMLLNILFYSILFSNQKIYVNASLINVLGSLKKLCVPLQNFCVLCERHNVSEGNCYVLYCFRKVVLLFFSSHRSCDWMMFLPVIGSTRHPENQSDAYADERIKTQLWHERSRSICLSFSFVCSPAFDSRFTRVCSSRSLIHSDGTSLVCHVTYISQHINLFKHTKLWAGAILCIYVY